MAHALADLPTVLLREAHTVLLCDRIQSRFDGDLIGEVSRHRDLSIFKLHLGGILAIKVACRLDDLVATLARARHADRPNRCSAGDHLWHEFVTLPRLLRKLLLLHARVAAGLVVSMPADRLGSCRYWHSKLARLRHPHAVHCDIGATGGNLACAARVSRLRIHSHVLAMADNKIVVRLVTIDLVLLLVLCLLRNAIQTKFVIGDSQLIIIDCEKLPVPLSAAAALDTAVWFDAIQVMRHLRSCMLPAVVIAQPT